MGLRERKKEKTRLALMDAALDLFLEQGYETTTIEQIAGSADVSSRTFFRYFTSKEHLVLGHHDEIQAILLDTLRLLPPEEPPFQAVCAGLRAVLREVEQSTPEDRERFLKGRRLMEDNPMLMGKAIGRMAETERLAVDEVARRQGSDPRVDQLPHLVVAFAMSAMRIGYECEHRDVADMRELTERVESAIALAERCLRPGWDLTG